MQLSPPFIIQDIYSRIPKKLLAYPECCKQTKNIRKPLKNLYNYSPLLHTKTNWTPCRDTSHLRAEHLLLFTPYSSTVYISQNPKIISRNERRQLDILSDQIAIIVINYNYE